MAARAYWQGQIRLALVSIPVEIYSAARSGASISFRQIHEPSGKPVKYEKVVPGIGPVNPEDILKGYEYERGHYVLLDQDEIEAVRLESKRTLELTQFVDFDEIDPIYFDKPYYVVPADDLAEEAFIVLREALRQSRKTAIGQLTLRGRENVVALKPCGRGMIMETLRYADELHKAASYFRSIPDSKPDKDLLDLATTLIDKKTASFDASEFHDRYVDALKEMIERKRKSKGKSVVTPEEEPAPRTGGSVADLMAALKGSLEKPAAPPKRRRTSPAKPAASASSTRAKPGARAASRKRA